MTERVRAWPVAVGIGAPLGTVGIAYAIWWISDRMVYVGPLDRAAFGWLVVVPVWMLAPIAAAYAWRSLSGRELALAVTLTGLVVGAAAAWLIWAASAFELLDCQFGALRGPSDFIPGSLFFGAVVGGGLAGICRGTLAVLRRAPWWAALLVGAGSQLVLVFVSLIPLDPAVDGTRLPAAAMISVRIVIACPAEEGRQTFDSAGAGLISFAQAV